MKHSNCWANYSDLLADEDLAREFFAPDPRHAVLDNPTADRPIEVTVVELDDRVEGR